MSTIHNPVNFDPQAYEVEDYLDNKRPAYYGQSVAAYEQEVQNWQAEIVAVLGADWRQKAFHCIHCGNGRVRWITAVRHKPTNEVVVFGSDCTERLGFANKQQFKLAQLQARDEARKVRLKIYRQREQFLKDHPDFAQATADVLTNPVHASNTFVKDVLHKLDQYGSLSDKQVSAVLASLARDREYAARKAAAAVEIKGNAPSGRQTVTGTVVSMKEYESQYGISWKMTLKLDNGARVWLTAPSRETIERGDTVTVTATFEVSNTDQSFAFGKRPHLVKRVAAVPTV